MYRMIGAALICGFALNAMADARPRLSDRTTWAKKDVAFDRYVADARQCGIQGGTMDVRAHESGKLALRVLQTQDLILNNKNPEAPEPGADQRYIRNVLDPNRRIDALQKDRVTTVETCLTERGYALKTLSRAERRQLGRLALGSPERRAYLHSIAAQ